MTLLYVWIGSERAMALGWALVHSLWEGFVVAAALLAVLALVRSPRARYAAACAAMVGLLAGFGVTIYRLMPPQAAHRISFEVSPAVVISHGGAPVVPAVATAWDSRSLLPWLTPLWTAGVLLFQLRLFAAWMIAGRLRRVGVCQPSAEWIERLDGLRARLRLTKTITFLESCLAEVPVVIGHAKPVILIPVGLLTGLPVGQIESILLHELAHIRRADYLVNLMQTAVEGLLFYHPAVWWISNVIRAERENCCDDIVVATRGDAHEYATALAAIETNRWTMREAAVAATGGNLGNRIRRLLAQPELPRTTFAPFIAAGIMIISSAALLAAWKTPEPRIATMIQAISAPSLNPTPLLVAQSEPVQRKSPYDKWLLEEVPYIITDAERKEFKALTTDDARNKFIEAFWERRNPVPGSGRNEYREEHYRRIAYVNDRFPDKKLPGWKTDRGRIYITYGPPDEIDSHPSGGFRVTTRDNGMLERIPSPPFERWVYRHIEGIGDNVVLEFADTDKTGEYRLSSPPKEEAPMNQAIENLESLVKAVNVTEEERALREQISGLTAQKEAIAQQAASLPEQIEAQDQNLERLRSELRLLQIQTSLHELNNPRLYAFHSGGAGAQAVVVITPERRMVVTIPYEVNAERLIVSMTTVPQDGKMALWARSEAIDNPCKDKTSCLQNSFSTMPPSILPIGNYTLNASVKDAEGSIEKIYVVNFSVN